MIVPKMYINAIRHTIKEITNANTSYLNTLEKYYNAITRSYVGIDGLAQKSLVIESFNKRYNTKFTRLTSKREIEKWYLEKCKIAKDDNAKLETILDALTREGFVKPTYNFPRVLMSLMISDSLYQSFILTGIKINASSVKKPTYLMDKVESDLWELEKAMAALIDDNYVIKKESCKRFLELYNAYLYVFTKFITETFGNSYAVSLDKRIDMNLENMRDYINKGREIVSGKDKPSESAVKQEAISMPKEDLLQKYVSNGKVVKVCDIEEFTKILDSADIPDIRKKEYLAQMINLTNRLANAERQKKIETLKQEVFTKEEIITYNEARVSNNGEATQVIKDVNAILELLLEAELEDREELIMEASSLLEYLQSILHPQESDVSKPVVYFKNNNEIPYIEENLVNVYGNDANIIAQDLIKIIDGKTVKCRELQGDLPIRVFFKGYKFKIFYSMINGIPLIIYGGSGKNVCQKVINLVNSREFLEYLKNMQKVFKSGTAINDSTYTDIIMKRLKYDRGLI
ncbi:MAG: hypothetical protein NC483_00875 [Ruminococcus sp.]|nr:hypothetical protein [Ruminococcus sp.]